jgi:hypothetical protein
MRVDESGEPNRSERELVVVVVALDAVLFSPTSGAGLLPGLLLPCADDVVVLSRQTHKERVRVKCQKSIGARVVGKTNNK